MHNNLITEFTARLIRASNFDIVNIWIWCIGVFVLVEFIFMGIETLFWGERFVHVFDIILAILIFTYFGFATWVMGEGFNPFLQRFVSPKNNDGIIVNNHFNDKDSKERGVLDE